MVTPAAHPEKQEKDGFWRVRARGGERKVVLQPSKPEEPDFRERCFNTALLFDEIAYAAGQVT